MNIIEAIKTAFELLKKLAEVKEVSIQNQSETTVNNKSKNATKAIKAANKAIDIATKYINNFERKDFKDFKKYKKEFDNNLGG